jgi:exonuclease SbcC
MIPIKLTLRGFYSYRSTQTIHFDKLTEAHIFGIFGSTGSGKSTIPEAISFALYGDTERLNQKEGRGYNMMNLKSDELFIDFIFMAGMIPQKYRATATAKRNSRNFSDVKTIERKAWQWNGVDWEPIEPSTIEGIIGLSYSNFKRTTIIPQGKFQEFLQLGDAERVKMMQELFGLEKFDLQFKTASVLKKSNETRIRLQTQVNELQGIDEAALNELNEQINAKTAVVEEVTRKLSDAQTREKDLLQHLETFKQHAEARKALDTILEKTSEIASLELRISLLPNTLPASFTKEK